jgi:hypothetical protein
MRRQLSDRSILLAVLLAAFVRGSSAASENATLDDSLRDLAKEIVDVVVKDQNQSAIAVGEFVGPADLDSNSGPGLTETLKSLLNELRPGIVQRQAPLSLRGRYDKVADPRDPTARILIKVTAEITDKNATRVDEKFAEIRDTPLLANLVGATVSLPPETTPPQRNLLLQNAIARPSFAGSGNKIRTTPTSPYAIEILVTSKAAAPRDAGDWNQIPARAPRSENGQAFVDIERNEVYAIRIHNDFEERGVPREAAVFVTIDGLDMFTFSEMRDPRTNRPRYSSIVVPPGTSVIPGWHKTNNRVDSFLVTEYGKGAASHANISRGKVGVITVRFATTAPTDKRSGTRGAVRRGRKETGFGPSAQVNLTEVDRSIGPIGDVISVRYSR